MKPNIQQSLCSSCHPKCQNDIFVQTHPPTNQALKTSGIAHNCENILLDIYLNYRETQDLISTFKFLHENTSVFLFDV